MAMPGGGPYGGMNLLRGGGAMMNGTLAAAVAKPGGSVPSVKKPEDADNANPTPVKRSAGLSSSSSSFSTSPKVKKPKMGPRRSTEDLDAATLLASMMKGEKNNSDEESGEEDEDKERANNQVKADVATPAGFANAVVPHNATVTANMAFQGMGVASGTSPRTLANLSPLDSRTNTPTLASDIKWFHGVVSLHLPEDDDVLSPLHCFMRRYCVEAFSATPEDVATPRYGKSHGFKVEVGQVGIRYVVALMALLKLLTTLFFGLSPALVYLAAACIARNCQYPSVRNGPYATPAPCATSTTQLRLGNAVTRESAFTSRRGYVKAL